MSNSPERVFDFDDAETSEPVSSVSRGREYPAAVASVEVCED